MSRSFKKHPVLQCCKAQGEKHFANKRVRRTRGIPNGKAYRKVYNSYDICDYRWRETFDEFQVKTRCQKILRSFTEIEPCTWDISDSKNDWEKDYRRK